MSYGPYTRFDLVRPEHVGQAHWEAIDVEIVRLARALEAGDDPQAIGYLKCVVEAVAKVVLDINGTPASGNENFDTVVPRAHELLAAQPGHELAYETPFGRLATQARKMAVAMGTIRNNFGAGHGRARQPEMRSEMLDLAIDGSLLWTRWALRRLGYFAQGRPEALIRDLVGDPHGSSSFYSGDLTERLSNANLQSLESKHARAIGVAVGQRAAMDTFNVRIEGVDACVGDPDLARWPAAYRIGVATGLLFSPAELPTFTARNLHQAMEVCTPIADASGEIISLMRRVMETRPPGQLPGEAADNANLIWFVKQAAAGRPEVEQAVWTALAEHLSG
ncbi:abortive infection family protein [Micromonospora noduli]|uniref:abortive infection family protein n=1 Tax=Micromonospora noduli TaxID=709876 RepID=UPI0015EC8B87|nr:abortive infection family protein [Micromonospora noduli]